MEQYLTAQDIAEKCRVSKSTVWRWAAAGTLPKPFKITPRTTVWKESEVIDALERMQANSVVSV